MQQRQQHTDESDDYVAWYDKATGTLYLKCYQGGKIVTAGYDNTAGYELRGIGCGGVLSIAESAKVDVNVTGGTPKVVYVANGLTTFDSMTLTVTKQGQAVMEFVVIILIHRVHEISTLQVTPFTCPKAAEQLAQHRQLVQYALRDMVHWMQQIIAVQKANGRKMKASIGRNIAVVVQK